LYVILQGAGPLGVSHLPGDTSREQRAAHVGETFFQWFNFAGFLCLKRPATMKPSES
jgi:hypothetical protein